MKTLLATLVFGTSFPVHAYEIIGHNNNHKVDKSEEVYAYENKCFHYKYWEKYIPGNSISPGYVKSYNEKISIPCNTYRKVFNDYHQKSLHRTSYAKYKKYKSVPKCIGSKTLGGLIGGGIAASLSKSDAYGWSIPLGVVLGTGIGDAECK